MTRLLAALGWTLALVWGMGQIVRDRTLPGQLAFYVPTPLALLALIAVALVAGATGRRRAAALAASAALVPLVFVLLVEHRWLPRAPQERGTIRVVHWNVRKGKEWERALPLAVGERADLYAISEPPWGRREREIGQVLGFPSEPLRIGQIALLARGKLGEPLWLSRAPLQVTLVPWEHEGVRWRLMVVDLVSDVRVLRQPHLARLRALAAEHGPDLIAGDLNAPRRSRALTPPPPGFVHAYEAAGLGWSATWPTPVPLWSIDHCLVGPRLRVRDYRLRTTGASDHRMQVIDLAPRYHGETVP